MICKGKIHDNEWVEKSFSKVVLIDNKGFLLPLPPPLCPYHKPIPNTEDHKKVKQLTESDSTRLISPRFPPPFIQPINQPVNQSINQPTDNQLINKSTNKSIIQ